MRFNYKAGLFFFAGLMTLSGGAGAQETRTVLTTESAKTIVAVCEAYAREKGWLLNIAVHDQGKNLMAFLRMDGAQLGSIDIALWKANSAAAFPRPTKVTADIARDFPAIGHAPHIAIFEGGEAIFAEDGTHLGGAGASGARGAEDAECVREGIKAAGLKFER